MILSRYLARRFTGVFLIVFLIFFGLMLMIDTVELIGRFGEPVGMRQVIGLAALRTPESLYRILPLIMVLAAVAFFLALARSSELVVIRATGRSGLRILGTPVLVALVVGSMAVMLFNPIVAGTSRHYEELVARYSNGESSVLSVSPEGLWLRQGGDGQQIVIRAGRSNDDGTELFDVTFLVFDEAGRPLSRTDASEARLTSGAWALSDVKKWNLGRENPEATATISATSEIRSDLTKDRIRDSFGDPSAVPIWDMPDFIAGLDAAGFSARRHKVWLQMELAQPFLMAGMVLLAAGFTMRHSRSGGTGAMVLAAVLSGFTIFFLRNFAQVLGENGQIPVLIAAWFPPLATILLALGMLLHVEDG